MLGKLLKYETKATARIFLPIYGVLLIFSELTRIFNDINNNTLVMKLVRALSIASYVFIIIGTFVLALVVMIQRFYKNLLSDEGYLMFTLPVKPRLLIESKLLVSMLWLIASIFFTAISVFVLAWDSSSWDSVCRVVNQFFEDSQKVFGTNGFIFILEFIIVCLISIAASILMIYAAVSIGQTFHKHKLLASFGAYVVLYMIIQAIGSIIVVIVSATNPEGWVNQIATNAVPHLFMLGIFVLELALSTGFYVISKHILTKRLNLE